MQVLLFLLALYPWQGDICVMAKHTPSILTGIDDVENVSDEIKQQLQTMITSLKNISEQPKNRDQLQTMITSLKNISEQLKKRDQIVCPCKAPSLKHGKGNVQSTAIGSKCSYTCNGGYYMDGNGLSICGSNGEWKWQGQIPSCKRVKCPSDWNSYGFTEAQIVFGKKADNHFRDKVGYKGICRYRNDEYDGQAGTWTVRCESDGTWKKYGLCMPDAPDIY